MSDYLANLLERSFAQPPEVRPQRPSLFEPAPATGLAEGPADVELVLETEARAPAPPPSGETPAMRPAPSERTEPAVSERRRDRQRDDRTTEPLAPKAVAAPAAQGPVPVIVQMVPAPAAGPAFRGAPSPGRSFPSQKEGVVGEKPVVPRADPQPESPAPSRDAVVPERAFPSAAFDGPRERRAAPKPFPDPRRNGDVGIEGVVVRPVNPAREKPALPLPAPGRKETAQFSPDTPPAVPTIQVTIGRVEVRAALPPSPRRPGAKKEPQMSLETYLQRRSEGGRR
jgi:hypothetical protein